MECVNSFRKCRHSVIKRSLKIKILAIKNIVKVKVDFYSIHI